MAEDRGAAWGSAALIAGPGAIVAAAPSALRLWAASSGTGVLWSWSVVAGLLVIPLWLAVTIARAARTALATHDSPRWTRLAFASGLTLAFALPVDAALAAALTVHTHHRALGGAAFAVLALVVHLLGWVLCYRLAAVVSSGPRARTTLRASALRESAAATGALTLTFGTVAALLLPLGPATPLRERALLLDLGLAVGVAVFGAAFTPRKKNIPLASGGAVLTVALAGSAAWLLRMHPELRAHVDAQAPLAAVWAQCLGFLE